jgi:hypothetical protein
VGGEINLHMQAAKRVGGSVLAPHKNQAVKEIGLGVYATLF